jgi:two-component system OmpR family sensor kinase
LLKYEKNAFWKFFSIYFGSVAFLILLSGFFYFQEQKKTLIEKEHFSMIEYVRQLKMQQEPKDTKYISHVIIDINIENFNMDNFDTKGEYFQKYMPFSWDGDYILVKKDKTKYYKKLHQIKIYIISVQILLLCLFAMISYFLAMRALKPMQDAITKLDNFSKDLIHDLNTPITSILLNMKILEASGGFEKNKALVRIKRSVEDIGELHNNLTLLLHEDTFIVQKESIFEIIKEVALIHQKIYTDIKFGIEYKEFYANVNRDAFKQVMVNIISNACKYNKKNGYIKIFVKDNALYIEDSGIGIYNPENIFKRSYKEHGSGHGIGLDIVKRLCDVMDIEIKAVSKVGVGTTISLKFKN